MMSDISYSSDKDSFGEKDEDFRVEDYQDDIDSDESFNALDNDRNSNDGGNDSSVESQNKSNDEYIGPVLPGGHQFNKKFLCIKYPGNVVNHEKAIETLGGLADISETVNTRNRRMELRFRPDDGYCKPACGDKHQTTGFLLRIRIKKSRRNKVEKESQLNSQAREKKTKNINETNSCESDKNKKIEVSAKEDTVNILVDKTTKCFVDSQTSLNESNTSGKNQSPTFDRQKYENLSEDTDYVLPKLKVLGRVDTEYRFTNLCDFQYLPITKKKEDPTKDECIYDSIYPVGLPPYSWMKNEVPYFLPPAAFSRMDTVQHYTPKTDTSTTEMHYVIGKTRKRRAGLSNFINFNTPYVPVNPPKGIETALKIKFLQSTHVEKMRKAFEERPIWSKTALMYVTNYSNEQLKVLLPAVAYYFMTGPWRITWARLGYDPRKDPEARKYQTLDYRLKAMHGLQTNITCKRNYAEYTLPYRNASNSKAKTMVLMPNDKIQSEKKQKMMDENVYIYRPGIIPPSRQMFYQYCDIHVKEIQDMLDKYVGPPPGTPCHEKLGWLPVGFDDLCREIINKEVRLELRKLLNIPENHPTTLPRKRKLMPSEKSRKRQEKRAKDKQGKSEQQLQQPAAMSIIDDDDFMQTDDDEWEDVLENEGLSTNEYDEDVEEEIEEANEQDLENVQEDEQEDEQEN